MRTLYPIPLSRSHTLSKDLVTSTETTHVVSGNSLVSVARLCRAQMEYNKGDIG